MCTIYSNSELGKIKHANLLKKIKKYMYNDIYKFYIYTHTHVIY